MGNFRPRSRFTHKPDSSRYAEKSAGRDRYASRDFERPRRKPLEMFDAICSKCRKECQVPFKPTGTKPVLCSTCFRQNEGSSGNFDNRDKNSRFQSTSSSPDLQQINAKLDKILQLLEDEIGMD